MKDLKQLSPPVTTPIRFDSSLAGSPSRLVYLWIGTFRLGLLPEKHNKTSELRVTDSKYLLNFPEYWLIAFWLHSWVFAPFTFDLYLLWVAVKSIVSFWTRSCMGVFAVWVSIVVWVLSEYNPAIGPA